jgi:cytochrome P450
MTDLILQIFAESLFGTDLGPHAGRVADAIVALSDSDATDREFMRTLPDWLPTRHGHARRLSKAVLTDTMHGIISQYRTGSANRGDLLALMLSALDKQGIDVVAEAPVLDIPMDPFVAGSETTASAMIWVLYLLASHIAVQEKLRGEVCRALDGRLPTFSLLPAFRYTEMVVKESLRLYPTADNLLAPRQAVEDIELGGYPLRRDSLVFTSQWVVHRDSRWFPEPDRFDPDRFSPENEQQLPQFAYFPFGGGPRVCIGNTYVMTTLTLVVATLLSRVRVRLVPDHDAPEPSALRWMRPKTDLPLLIEVIS